MANNPYKAAAGGGKNSQHYLRMEEQKGGVIRETTRESITDSEKPF